MLVRVLYYPVLSHRAISSMLVISSHRIIVQIQEESNILYNVFTRLRNVCYSMLVSVLYNSVLSHTAIISMLLSSYSSYYNVNYKYEMYESLVIQIHCKVLSITISLRFLSNFCRCLVYYFRPKISEKPEDSYAYNGVEAVSTVSHFNELCVSMRVLVGLGCQIKPTPYCMVLSRVSTKRRPKTEDRKTRTLIFLPE